MRLDKKKAKIHNKGFSFIIGRLPMDFDEKKNEKQKAKSYEIINYLVKDKPNKRNQCPYKGDKISIKLMFYKDKSGKILIKELLSLLEYAKKRNVFVYIDALYCNDRNLELQTYLTLFKHFDNIGITLAAYHNTIDKSVNKIILNGGHIRLVKGYYNDYSVKNWQRVKRNYINNAIKLIKSSNFHTLATHDFNILNLLFKNYSKEMQNIELAFFWFAKKHVFKNLKGFKYKISMKCFYYPLGNPMGSFEVLKKIDFGRAFQRSLEHEVK